MFEHEFFSHFISPLAQVLDASIRLLQLPTDETDADDEHFIDVEDTPGYQAAFCQLSMAGKKDFDPFKGEYDYERSVILLIWKYSRTRLFWTHWDLCIFNVTLKVCYITG